MATRVPHIRPLEEERPHIRPLKEERSRLRTARVAFWTLCGALVVLYVFFVALSGISPSEAKTVTGVIVALALLWLAHSWRHLLAEGNVSPRGDRERRGF